MKKYLIIFGMLSMCVNLNALIGDVVSDVVGTAEDITGDIITTADDAVDTAVYPLGLSRDRIYYDSDGDYIVGLESENDRLRAENKRLQRETGHLRGNGRRYGGSRY